ncbi:hypothetical protein XFLM_05305 [Xylella fastidiosa subsp. fastidiosa GB514]|nr:hypothetical protein XFLM_05305 [Xylella fastidiosa subsp. fastidiosa GB514]AIC14124.1 hypothetical protein P303_11880 [Xylella fastidiosa MUL0034]
MFRSAMLLQVHRFNQHNVAPMKQDGGCSHSTDHLSMQHDPVE